MNTPRYSLEQPIGNGAYAEVWLAVDSQLGRRVALKFFRKSSGEHDIVVQQARALARIQHNNVVTVHDVVEMNAPDGSHSSAVVMELLEGPTLNERLNGEKLTREEVESLLTGLVSGLVAIHEAGIAHRDVHTGNVIIIEGRGPVWIDMLHLGTRCLHTQQLQIDFAADKKRFSSMCSEVIHQSTLSVGQAASIVRAIDSNIHLNGLAVQLKSLIADVDEWGVDDSDRFIPQVHASVHPCRATVGNRSGVPSLHLRVGNHAVVPVYLESVSLEGGSQPSVVPVDGLIHDLHPENALLPGRLHGLHVPMTAFSAEILEGQKWAELFLLDGLGRRFAVEDGDLKAAIATAVSQATEMDLFRFPSVPADGGYLDVLNLVATELLAGRDGVPQLEVQIRLGVAPGEDSVAHAVKFLAPFWVSKSRYGSNKLSLTAPGLLESALKPRVELFVKDFLAHLKRGVYREYLEFEIQSEALLHDPLVEEDSVALMGTVLNLFSLTGSGSSSGSPPTSFKYAVPHDLERLLSCQGLSDVLPLHHSFSAWQRNGT